MIELLRIRDFALVDEVELELGEGFTALTGETGAGKSILLQALGLLLGERASRDGVRVGAEAARVEGLFSPRGAARAEAAAVLGEAGIPWEEGEPLLVARTVGSDGRSRAHVNGALAPLAVLARLGRSLVEVSSQHQHQGLLREETHRALLDASLDEPGRAAREAYGDAYHAWRAAEAEVGRLEGLEARARERAETLRHEVEELRAVRAEPGEGERLRQERDLLVHAGRLLEAYGDAEAELYSGAEASLDRLARAARAVEDAGRRDPAAGPLLELLAEAKALLEEAALGLRDRRAALEADPGRLEEVEERLDALRRLERKHGVPAEALAERLRALEEELWEAENTEFALERAGAARDRTGAALAEAGRILREARGRAGKELGRRVGAELEALALGPAAFSVEVRAGEPGAGGADQVRFLLAPNPGEPPLPLARIASGGELSRVLLALKNALRDAGVETLVFDEVDAGIGGAVAAAVGERLAALAPACQVLCITHLPQIAGRAGRHLRVEKVAEEGRTVTRVRPLDPQERVEELARMLGGRRVTETTREHARELLQRSAP
ncbi:MAG: DNA repair protein RecN [Deferrisomatales bacterium]|nr:DNA repair protein RecN [Deferrisomatales bacterium]